ncbi:MAG: sugar-binding domain-containing protein, partial [Dyadobacter sp.]
MQKLFASLVLSTAIFFQIATAQQSGTWKMVEGKISTPWAQNVNAVNPHPEYPRPQLVREKWVNLNGLWSYSIVPKVSSETKPTSFHGNILVPFAVESALSGVGKTVGKDSVLWYNRKVNFAIKTKSEHVLLHFGAVDWECDVFVNGQKAGSHKGGYDPFSIDITSFLLKGNNQDISVRVWDPSSDGPQPRGKQIKNPNSIWYTPVTGIWQTVWLETVPLTYIASTRNTPDIDKEIILI